VTPPKDSPISIPDDDSPTNHKSESNKPSLKDRLGIKKEKTGSPIEGKILYVRIFEFFLELFLKF